MGRVVCANHHGNKTGPLCSAHVLEAADEFAEAASLPALIQFKIDIGDKDGHHLAFIVCESCAGQYDISQGAILPDEWFAEDRLPWTAPVCATCLSALQATLGASMFGRPTDGSPP